MKKLKFDNLLGLDENLRNGNLKTGKMNAEILETKRQFPHEILMYRCGEFYEAVGFDACMLVEYANLNPMAPRSDSVPRAGCPIMNLRQTLDQLTYQGFSVCIVEEVQGPQARGQLKERFVAGHAHPGSPYVYGLVSADVDLEFPEPVPVMGISRSRRGYCLVSVLEMMHSFSVEDGLTEEAVVTKLRSRQCQQLFMHRSLRKDIAGIARWGEGGLLFGECQKKQLEWYDDDPVKSLILKVREIFDLDQDQEFREIVVPSGERPRPLYVSTASQIGILPTAGVPSLLMVLLPPEANYLCTSYVRNLLLHPPPHRVADCVQAACRMLAEVTSSIPDFTCVSAAKLMKLIETQEANHIEFARMRNIAEDILLMANDPQLSKVLDLLLDPTWLATGIRIERKQLVDDCKFLASRIGDLLASERDPDQNITSLENIPDDFFRDLEEPWKGRVKRSYAEEEFVEVEESAAELAESVFSDLLPIVNCVKGYQKPLGGGLGGRRGEICYSRDSQAVWFKGKNFRPTVWGDSPGEAEMKLLISAYDGKGKKAGEEWWTTSRVEDALTRYRAAVEKASSAVVQLLRDLAAEVKVKLNALVFISVLSVIAKSLCLHVSEGKRRNWVFPTLMGSSEYSDSEEYSNSGPMVLEDLIPYWKDPVCEQAEPNTVELESMFLLTGPNGGGKSSILRSICAAALLSVCGLMVPARNAVVPRLDAVMLRMMSTDSPADNKSSFQMEMSELRTILAEATSRSLVMIDELCRGTEVQKGTAIAASVIESLDHIGCRGVLSTHLHDLLDMKLRVRNVVKKSMSVKEVDGRIEPTWKLVDGACRESLAFEVAKKEGIPDNVVQRAIEIYKESLESKRSSNGSTNSLRNNAKKGIPDSRGTLDGNFLNDMAAEGAVNENNQTSHELTTLQDKKDGGNRDRRRTATATKPREELLDHMELFSNVCRKKLQDLGEVSNFYACSFIGPRQLPPPATTMHSCVYILQRPDGRYYVGQSDNLTGRVRRHRSILPDAPFLYLVVPNKSVASELETTLIHQLPSLGVILVNKGDQNHRHFGTAPLIDAPPF
ncbi:hypothetical protein KC19_3G013500 [Ceratodon purpureus]|nr:hypothetical protein KC19_3G013500 [Ceratodon purpureus]